MDLPRQLSLQPDELSGFKVRGAHKRAQCLAGSVEGQSGASSSNMLSSRRGGSKGLAEWKRQQAFDRVWNKMGLSTDMDSSLLADNVIAMRVHGVIGKSSTILASRRVKAKEDPAYEEAYLARTARLSTYLSNELADLRKDSYWSKQDEKTQMNMALQETFKRSALYDRKRKEKLDSQGRGMTLLAANKAAAARIEKIGMSAREHIEAMGYDFDTMPLKLLEKKTRDLQVPGVKPKQLTRSLYRYIQHQRDERDVDMAAIKRIRRTVGMQRYKQARRREPRQPPSFSRQEQQQQWQQIGP